MVNAGEERERFTKLTLDFMSEESSCDEEFTIHQPAWRLYSINMSLLLLKNFLVLTKFLHELDDRVKELNTASDAKQKRKTPERKPRVQGSPLMSIPSERPPKWTIYR